MDPTTLCTHDAPNHHLPQPSAAALAQSLHSKQWWGFDLDDTLHHFRAASGAAAATVFAAIHAAHPTVATATLAQTYGQILRSATGSAFTDGRPSTAHRRERFAALLRGVGVDGDDAYVDTLVGGYKDALRGALRATPGAVELLRGVKARRGRRVAVVTEGPLDAQRWTLDALGLAPYVDVLATSGGMRVAKTEGLFEAVFREHGIAPGDVVFVGDSVERDVVPALEAGVGVVIYVGDAGEEMFEGVVEREKSKFARVKSLEEIVQALDYIAIDEGREDACESFRPL